MFNIQGLFVLFIFTFYTLYKQQAVKLLPVIAGIFITLITGVLVISRINNQIPASFLHDSAAQTEVASTEALKGNNPYTFDFTNTEFGKIYKEIIISSGETFSNPALQAYAYPPGMLVIGVIGKLLSVLTGIFYDFRLVLWVFYIIAIVLLEKLFQHHAVSVSKKTLVYVVLFFHIYSLLFLNGMNDIIPFSFFLLFVLLMLNKKDVHAALVLSIGCTVKQSLWILLPVFMIYTCINANKKDLRHKLAILGMSILPFLIITMPFFLWNRQEFINDVILYQAGKSGNIYPISGIGFSNILYNLGLLGDNRLGYFPFWNIQIIATIIALIIIVYQLTKTKSLHVLLQGYGILLFALWYFGRYFHTNHAWFIIAIIIISQMVRGVELDKEKL